MIAFKPLTPAEQAVHATFEMLESHLRNVNDALAQVGAQAAAPPSVTANMLIASKFYEENNWTAALTGVNPAVTATARYTRLGKLVTIFIPHLVGSSNANTCTITGLPATLKPSRDWSFLPRVMDNGSIGSGTGLVIQVNGVIQLYTGGATVFTAAGNKGLYTLSGADNYAFTYTLR
jgi:hypothetical protein